MRLPSCLRWKAFSGVQHSSRVPTGLPPHLKALKEHHCRMTEMQCKRATSV
jgi:hypothetical protein